MQKAKKKTPGTLYLVATPIGNLGDMTMRAIETLKKVDIIACEDTRHTRKLLNHFQIPGKLVSYHEHNEAKRSEELASKLADGLSIALVSDAGTPAINDPGSVIIKRSHDIGANVVPIPGAVAFVNAVIISGLPADSIFFGGFFPSKKGDRLRRLREVESVPATLVFYESPRRVERSLKDCLEVLGNRKAAIVKELTKIHEQVIIGKIKDLLNEISSANLRGEFVLIFDRESGQDADASSAGSFQKKYADLTEKGIDRKSALKVLAKEFGISRSEAYRLVQIGDKEGK